MENKLDLTLKLKPLLDGAIIEPSNSNSANAEQPDAWLSNNDKQLLQNLCDIHVDLDDPLIFLYNGQLSQPSMSTLEHIVPRGSGIGALPNQATATINSLMPNIQIQQKLEDALIVTADPKSHPARSADDNLEKKYDTQNIQGNILDDLGISTQSSSIANMNINAKATNQLVTKNSVSEQRPIDILDEYLLGELCIASQLQHSHEVYFNKSVYDKPQIIKLFEAYAPTTMRCIKIWKKQILG